MKDNFLVFVLLTSIIGSSECASLRLNVSDEWEYRFDENKSLIITCTGDKPVNWRIMEEVQYFKCTNGFNGTEYYSTLEITYIRKENTGNYNCSYIGEKGPTISTYIYVNDGRYGYVKDKYSFTETFWLDIGKPIVFDCRTTTPGNNVTILKDGKDVTEEFSLDYLRRFSKLAVSVQESGNYRCIDKLFQFEKVFTVNVQDPNKLQKPWISLEDKSKAIFLKCTIPIEKNLTFKWIFPVEPEEKEIFSFKNQFNETSILYINKPSVIDYGDYTCIVERGDSSSWDIINVKKEKIPFVRFSKIRNADYQTIYKNEGENFTWVTYFDGYPNDLIFTFYKFDKNLFEGDKRISTIYNYEEKELTLRINKISAEDTGNYSVKMETPDGSYDENYSLLIVNEQSLNSGNISIIIQSVVLFVVIFCAIIFHLYVRHVERINAQNEYLIGKQNLALSRKAGCLNKECTIGDQIEMLPYDNIYEVEKENIRLGKQLGAGSFGRVLLAEVKGLKEAPSPKRVAVKMCKYEGDKTHLRSLILELKILIHLGKHLNIVNLIGAHTSNLIKGELWILLEYCKYGNLLKFIQRSKANFINQFDPTTGDVNVHKASLLSNKLSSPNSLGSRIEFWREETLDSDENFEAHHERFMNTFRSKGQHPSPNPKERSNLNSDGCQERNSGASMKKIWSVGRQSSTSSKTRSKEQNSPSNSPTHECEGEHLEMAAELPLADSKSEEESSVFNPISESDFYAMFNTDETLGYAPPPFPPALDNIPGVSSPFTTVDLICWAWQIAKGMEFLTSRNVLHGDLAARNLLLADDNVVKICDFGLSREMYQNDKYIMESNNIMPIKWMSPEAIKQNIFSIQSDVWAYGVTLWELFTLGDSPYAGLPIKREFVITLEKGMRLEKPLYCSEEIYSLLLDCWQLNPVERPSFCRISKFFSEMLSLDRKQPYVNMNSVYKQKNEEWLSQNEDYLTMVIRPDFKNLVSHLPEERKIPEPFEGKCMFDADYLAGEQCEATGGYLEVLKPKPDHLLRPRRQKDQITNMKAFVKYQV